MSQIFDGLQRSEAERSATEEPGFPGATELLRRSERQVALRWEAGVLSEKRVGTGIEELKLHTVPPTRDEPVQPENTDSPFDEFPTLEISLAPQNRLACLTDRGSPAAEAFRLLGVRLRDLRHARQLKTVLITSTIPQEGKSMVAANLACALSQGTQQRVLLLEGDLRRPSLSQMFGLGKNPGFTECLDGGQSLTTSIYHLERAGLWFLPSGSAPTDAAELLRSGRLSILMDKLKSWFDWVIVDSPPVLPLADTSVWMRSADGILLIVRQGTTEKKHLQRGIEAVESKKLIGAVLNSSKHSSDGYYYYNSVPASIDKA